MNYIFPDKWMVSISSLLKIPIQLQGRAIFNFYFTRQILIVNLARISRERMYCHGSQLSIFPCDVHGEAAACTQAEQELICGLRMPVLIIV